MHVTNQSPLHSLPGVASTSTTAVVRAQQLPRQPSWLSGSNVGVAAAGATACALMAYGFYKMSQSESKQEMVANLIANTRDLEVLDKKRHIQKFIDHIWPTLHLTPPSSSIVDRFKQIVSISPDSDDLRSYLTTKISIVLTEHKDQSDELKEVICIHIIQNFEVYIQEATAHVQRDIEKDDNFRQTFGIQPGDFIVSLSACGKETHVEGKNPLIITLNNGKKIVYKPRSMAAEQLICHRANSLFANWNPPLGTYQVYNKPEENYGYCEFLVNQQRDNTFESLEDPALDEYVQRFMLMDQIGQVLGLSDMHAENVITVSKWPRLTDTEVVLLPTNTEGYKDAKQTTLIDGTSAGWIFYAHIEDVKNRIWIKENENTFILQDFAVQALGKKFVNILENYSRFVQPLSLVEREKIEETRQELKKNNHRIVLVGTEELISAIKQSLEIATEDFMTHLKKGLISWEIETEWDDPLQTAIRQHFKTDVENNDVPIFYFNPSTREVRYHNTRLGIIRPEAYS